MAKNTKPKPNFTMVLGSALRLANHNHNKPKGVAKMITYNEFEELFTPFGSRCNPRIESLKLFAAKMLKEPPLCSKNAQKKIEKIINNIAATIFLFSTIEKFRISNITYNIAKGPMVYINQSVYSVLATINMISGTANKEPVNVNISLVSRVFFGKCNNGDKPMLPSFF